MKYYGLYKGVELYTNDLDPDKYYHFSNNEYYEIIITHNGLIKDKFWSKEYFENKYFESHRYSINGIRFDLHYHTTIPKNIPCHHQCLTIHKLNSFIGKQIDY